MKDINLALPFIAKSQNETENLTDQAEVAYISCMAEMARKKNSFLRDTPEKLSLIAKIYYLLWVVPTENQCLVLDSLGLISHKFSFKEPTKTGLFIEELKKNCVNHEKFMDALRKQTKEIWEFTESANFDFKSLVGDKELLTFFEEYFKMGNYLNENDDISKSLFPMDIDEKAASETGKLVTDSLRTIQANSKGLQYALSILNEEAEFHKHSTIQEIERLKEKCENEIAKLKPEVDKKVKMLTQKHDKTLTSVHLITERKVTALEKKREHHIRKLQSTEKRKATIEERREQAKRKKTASKTYRGAYELNSCESEINNIKKEVKAVNETIDKVKNEGINNAKKLEVEFHKVVAQEEGKIKQLNDTFEAKINDKKQQIDEITKEVVTIKSSFENIMQELKHSSSALRQQIEIRCELDTQEKPFRALLPIYIVKYVKGSEERYTLFLPISISQDVSVLNGLRKIITFSSDPKLKGVTRSASKKLHETLTMNVIGRIQNDVEFKNRVNNLLRANNFLDTMEFAETLNLGLDELTKLNWMTSEEAVSLCKSIMGEGA